MNQFEFAINCASCESAAVPKFSACTTGAEHIDPSGKRKIALFCGGAFISPIACAAPGGSGPSLSPSLLRRSLSIMVEVLVCLGVKVPVNTDTRRKVAFDACGYLMLTIIRCFRRITRLV